MFEILPDTSAKQDVDEIFKWYERERLGFEFLISFNSSLEVLAQTPHADFNVTKNIQRMAVTKFPYMPIIQLLKMQYIFTYYCINTKVQNNGR